jgi:isoleucyl-tRNA synthetase
MFVWFRFYAVRTMALSIWKQRKIDQNQDFQLIAEGVDQTRGWFYTQSLLVLWFLIKWPIKCSFICFRKTDKMSKRLGNAADPFETLKSTDQMLHAGTWFQMLTLGQLLKFDLKELLRCEENSLVLYTTPIHF